MKIWKYELPAKHGKFSLDLPVGWQKLDIQIQNGVPVMWCAVNEKLPTEYVNFYLMFTGEEYLTALCEYIATFQSGPLVYHLFRI